MDNSFSKQILLAIMRNMPFWEKIISLSFDHRDKFDKERERIIIYPKIDDIVLIEGDDNYSTIFFTTSYGKSINAINNTSHLRFAKTLKYFDERLEEYGCFFRCNKGAIVNLRHVSLLKYRTVYLNYFDKAIYLSADSVNSFKEAMARLYS